MLILTPTGCHGYSGLYPLPLPGPFPLPLPNGGCSPGPFPLPSPNGGYSWAEAVLSSVGPGMPPVSATNPIAGNPEITAKTTTVPMIKILLNLSSSASSCRFHVLVARLFDEEDPHIGHPAHFLRIIWPLLESRTLRGRVRRVDPVRSHRKRENAREVRISRRCGRGSRPGCAPQAHVVAGPDDAAFEVGPIADARSGEQDAALYGGFGTHPAARADRDAPDEGDLPSDHGVPSDHHRPFEDSCSVEPSIPVDPEILP